MTKKDLNSARSETAVVRGTITVKQKKIIQDLVGVLGSNEQDVIGKIITLWLYNEGYLKNGKIKTGEDA